MSAYTIDDDEFAEQPMPIPASWATREHGAQTNSVAEEIRAGGLGFALGMLIVLPAVLMATDRFGDVQSTANQAAAVVFPASDASGASASSNVATGAADADAAGATALTEVTRQPTTLSASAADIGSVVNRATPTATLAPAAVDEREPAAEPSKPLTRIAPVAAVRPATNVNTRQITQVAAALIRSGDVIAARRALESARASGDPNVLFALAETYDPNVLNALSRQANAAPDIERARGLYVLASIAGVAEAKLRIDSLLNLEQPGAKLSSN
ncbi:MAG: hypothetical protein AAF732_21315 [Pseudomonadota bacterium]